MAGELYLKKGQIGKETTRGTPVAATRIIYGTTFNLVRTRDISVPNVDTGTRDGDRDAHLRTVQAAGTFTQPLSADECIEPFLAGIQGGVTPSTSGAAKKWVFKPGTALDPLTLEWHDGARNHQGTGYSVDTVRIQGSITGDNMLECGLFGLDRVVAAATGSLTDRLPDFMEGWETKLYIDAFGGTPGTTAQAGLLIDWNFQSANNLARKYTANNTTKASAVNLGDIAATLELTFEAAASQALTEYNNWESGVRRLVRLEWGNNVQIGAGPEKKMIQLDLPCVITAVDVTGEDAQTRTYKFSCRYISDIVNAFPYQLTVFNNRATAY